MKASELLFNSQKLYVESDLGINSSVKYIYGDNTTLTDLKVFIEHVKDNELKSDTNLSYATLSNVILPKAPEQNDTVRLENDARFWKVQSWRFSNGMYLIDLTATRRRI